MFLVTKCLARLTGLASNYGVGFSPWGTVWCASPGLALLASAVTNRKLELCLEETVGPVHGFLWAVIPYLGFPASGQWIMVGWCWDWETDCVQRFNPIFTNVLCPRRQENTFSNQVSVRHTSQELFSQDPTSLQCQVSFFPSGLHMIHKEWILGNFNLKFAIRLIVENRGCILLHSHLGSNTSVLVTEAPS